MTKRKLNSDESYTDPVSDKRAKQRKVCIATVSQPNSSKQVLAACKFCLREDRDRLVLHDRTIICRECTDVFLFPDCSYCGEIHWPNTTNCAVCKREGTVSFRREEVQFKAKLRKGRSQIFHLVDYPQIQTANDFVLHVLPHSGFMTKDQSRALWAAVDKRITLALYKVVAPHGDTMDLDRWTKATETQTYAVFSLYYLLSSQSRVENYETMLAALADV